MRTYTLLLIDQESFYQRIIDLALSTLGITYKLYAVSSCAEAEPILRNILFDLIITDQGDADPLTVFEITGKCNSSPPVLIFSAKPDFPLIVDSFRAGVMDYMLKPCAINELAERLHNCLLAPATRGKNLTRPGNQTNQEKQLGDMQAAMAHDIRSPIISMLAGITHLRMGSFGWMDKEVACQLGKLDNRCHKLLDMTNEYLTNIFKSGETDISSSPRPELSNDIRFIKKRGPNNAELQNTAY